jgi:hypothetical protein
MMQLTIIVVMAMGILYLKARCRQFSYYGRNPLKGHKHFIGFSTKGE